MKPVPFRYVAPLSVDQALEVLAEEGDEARALAGGQSLGPLLNMRIAAPGVLLDINRLAELDYLRIEADGALVIGSLTRQRAVEVSDDVSSSHGLLVEAVSQIGHRAIRNRGTIGGSVAHADPAAELPAALVALDAIVHVGSSAGVRSIPASRFFLGPFSTALQSNELLMGITVPPARPRTGQAWMEVARRHGDYGVVGVAATVEYGEDGLCSDARLVYSGADWTPWEPGTGPDLLRGESLTPDLLEEVGRVVAAGSAPPADIHASAAYRRRLISVLTVRALARCASRVSLTGEHPI